MLFEVLGIVATIVFFILCTYFLTTVRVSMERDCHEYWNELSEEERQSCADYRGIPPTYFRRLAITGTACTAIAILIHVSIRKCSKLFQDKMGLIFLLQMYCWWVVFRAYQYIKAKQIAITTGKYQVGGLGGATVVTYFPHEPPLPTYKRPAYNPMQPSAVAKP